MERTQDHVIAVMTRVGDYPGITTRWFVFLRQKKLLPELQRGHGSGNAAYYCWIEPDIIKRVAVLYDLLPLHQHVKNAYLPLWLLGFDVPLDIIRARLIKWAEGDIFQMTRGINDGEKIEEILGDWIYDDAERSQRSRRESPSVSYAFVEEVLQPAVNILANRNYTINKMTVKKLLKRVSEHEQKNNAVSVESVDFWRQPDVIGRILAAAKFIQQHLSVHGLHDAIATATEDELRRAQHDFGTVVRFLRLLPMGDLNDTEWWNRYKYHVLTWLGCFAVIGSLALRHSGYSTYVDQAVAWLDHSPGHFRDYGSSPQSEPLHDLWQDYSSPASSS